jgi:exodeoxyribonuclease V gamma subunit
MAHAFQPGFMVFHGNRLEDLRDLTVGLLQNNPLPPLVPETLLVQSNGMKHWLEMALADDAAMGICAATHTELPSSFIWRMYRLVLGANVVPASMPFDKQALVWRLWRLLPEFAKTHQVEPLLAYVKNDPLGRQRYQLVERLGQWPFCIAPPRRAKSFGARSSVASPTLAIVATRCAANTSARIGHAVPITGRCA